MATDLTTSNVVDTKSGTGWTIDVTACNLLSDLSIKDFVVLIESVVSPNTNFTKTSQTILTYTGTSISSSTVEVRRLTPEDRFQEISFADKLSSSVFNEEIDRIIRKSYEYTLNGIGPGSVATTVTPLNEAYPGTWSGDTVRSRTANQLFTEFEKRGTLSESETITGTWTAPTASDATNNTQLATTAFAHTRVTNALTNSPILAGTPTAPTATAATDTTQIATTAFVKDVLETLIYPVGSIYINATSSTNPGTLLGFGTWVVFGAGRVLVGIDSGDTDFDTSEETGGSKTHTLTTAEMPTHSHSPSSGGFSFLVQGGAGAFGLSTGASAITTNGTTDNAGSGNAHNNVQPYIVVYMWKRTA